MLLESESLGRDLAQRMELDLTPERSWRVMIGAAAGEMRWAARATEVAGPGHARTGRGLMVRAWVRLARQFPVHREVSVDMIVKFSTRHGQLTMLGEPAVAC